MRIHTITVELLRAGPRYNQLLSPLTQYLGICGQHAAGVIAVPYEHARFEHALEELSYRVGDASRLVRLEKTGEELAELLGAIPGLAGSLGQEGYEKDALVNLRIVLSASELAILPFELAKVPAAMGRSSGDWLALGTPPVCISRHIRSVSAEDVRWDQSPRILFVSGPDVPFESHRKALREVIEPWANLAGTDLGAKEEVGLTILEGATLTEIERTLDSAIAEGRRYSLVHILAHGAVLPSSGRAATMGVDLEGGVVDGRTLANSLVRMGSDGLVRPVVVTVATCESARVSDVKTPDASVAHDLHDRGIPLVIASQFPLSEEGSVPFVEILYKGLLWGEHPLESLWEVRQTLFSRGGQELHDWASLVAYEAFPPDFDEKRETFRYWQTRRALDRTLERLEALAPDAVEAGLGEKEAAAFAEGVRRVDGVSGRLPSRGPYALECSGLRAAASKRIAQVAFKLACGARSTDRYEGLLQLCLGRLEAALREYRRAASAFLGTSEPVHKKANLHWLLGQVLSMEAVLGRESDPDSWAAARFAARLDLEDPNEGARCWAHVSLCELELLRLAAPDRSESEREGTARECLRHARRIVELLGRESEQARSTRRQFERYAAWWGNPEYAAEIAAMGIPDRPHWQQEHGLVPTAGEVVRELRSVGTGRSPGRGSGSGGGGARPESAVGETEAADSGSPAPGSPPEASSGVAAGTTIFDIEMLPAENGDCLWIEYGDSAKPHRVLIDCGAPSAAEVVRERIDALEKAGDDHFDLFVLTHIDSDHISGVIPLFEEPHLGVRWGDIWFNGWRQLQGFLSVDQGERFSELLGDPERDLPWNGCVTGKADRYPKPIVVREDASLPTFELSGGMRLTLLSPGPKQLLKLARQWKKALEDLDPKKLLGRKPRPQPVEDFESFDLESLAAKRSPSDQSAANGSSIAFLAEFGGRGALFTGDAHASVVAESIDRLLAERDRSGETLEIDALKLSHHGSANALTKRLLDRLDCPRYLVSTDGSRFHHPDREAIGRAILYGGESPTLYFNYRSELNRMWDNETLRRRFGYRAVFPAEKRTGLRVRL